MGKRDIPVGRLGLVVIAAAGMTACVSRAGLETSAAPLDPNSRIGQAMIEAMRNPGPYPKFSDIPKVPADMASPAPFAEVIAPLVAQRTALGSQVASLPQASPARRKSTRPACARSSPSNRRPPTPPRAPKPSPGL